MRLYTLNVIVTCLLTFSSLAGAQTNFFIESISKSPSGSVTIAWPNVPNQTYYVYYADSIDGPWHLFPNGTLNVPFGNTLSYFDFNATGVTSQRFYKVRTSQPSYSYVVMTLVLDRSGSMASPGVGTAIAGAVSNFINLFNDNQDEAAMVSFATIATVDVSMRRPFKQAISTAANNLAYSGATFAQGGLTNALVQNNSVIVSPGQNPLKVAVFFTDGFPNIFQTTLNCPPQRTWNIGGYEFVNTVGFFDPTNGNQICTTSGGTPACCSGTNRFQSAIDGTLKSFLGTNVTDDAYYRTLQVANDMRAAGMVVYSIGFGTGVNTLFLQQVANDTNSPTFNPSLPAGAAVIAPTTADLNAVFQQIATKIQSH